jgi:DNA-binding NarL/FixJ family response regulator
VALVAKGMTNREVATQLYVSDKAVEYHLRNIFGKLGIHSRRELRGYSIG